MSSNATLDRFQDAVTLPGHVNSGVDGDTNHTGEGYHTWRRNLEHGDYSGGQDGLNVSKRDLGGRNDCSAAVDIGLPADQMRAATGRLIAATTTDGGRFLLRGLREFNGTVDSRTTLNRDVVLGWRQNYRPNPSHLEHIHLGFFRDVCEDWDTVSDVLAVVNGTSKLTLGGAAAPTEEDILAALTEDELKALVQQQMIGVARSPEFRTIVGDAVFTACATAIRNAKESIAVAVWGQMMTRKDANGAAPALGPAGATNFLTAVLADTRAIRQKIGV